MKVKLAGIVGLLLIVIAFFLGIAGIWVGDDVGSKLTNTGALTFIAGGFTGTIALIMHMADNEMREK